MHISNSVNATILLSTIEMSSQYSIGTLSLFNKNLKKNNNNDLYIYKYNIIKWHTRIRRLNEIEQSKKKKDERLNIYIYYIRMYIHIQKARERQSRRENEEAHIVQIVAKEKFSQWQLPEVGPRWLLLLLRSRVCRVSCINEHRDDEG